MCLPDEIKERTAEEINKIWRDEKLRAVGRKRAELEAIPLEILDEIRDKILLTPGDIAFDISNENMSVEPFTNFAKRTAQGNLNTINTQYGLCLKTYQSDLFNNWLKTEWIDGSNGINQITDIDTSSGSFTVDALNLATRNK